MIESRISHKTKKALTRPEFNPRHCLWEEMQNHLKFKSIITDSLKTLSKATENTTTRVLTGAWQKWNTQVDVTRL